jgi:Peptidase inhibitor family I36
MATHSLGKKRLPLLGRRRLRTAAIVVAATPALALAVVVLPSATPAYAYSCGLNELCTWQNSNYGGTQWNFGIGGEGYWWYVGDGANDQISSIYNHTGGWKAWVDKDCPAGGQYTWIGNGSQAPNLANNKWPNGTTMNDSISAFGLDDNSVPAHGSRTGGGC